MSFGKEWWKYGHARNVLEHKTIDSTQSLAGRKYAFVPSPLGPEKSGPGYTSGYLPHNLLLCPRDFCT